MAGREENDVNQNPDLAGREENDMNQTPDQCAIRQVDITIPKTDDPSLPAVTFRMWVLGLASCVLLSFINQFFWYRTQPLTVSSISAQIAVIPLGHLMARTITNRVFLKGTRFEFTLNPGPFNIKEHVLITIFANSGAGSVYASHVLSAVKLFFKKELTFLPALILMITTQVLGFGWAGIFRKYLVEPEEMWWPGILVQVSLFRALHEKEKRPKGGFTRTQFFIMVSVASFAYYIFPGYLMPLLTAFSWLCWVAPKSVFVQQLGSGMKGLGLGSLGLDWTSLSSYLGSPLASPWFATVNIAVGFFLVMYVMTPITYWLNIYDAQNFPIFSSHFFMADGSKYEVAKIVDKHFRLDEVAYEKYGQLHLSTFFAMAYGLGFAALSATVVHIILFHGKEIVEQTRKAFGGHNRIDIHNRLMKSYKQVPLWWFLSLLVVNIVLILFACSYYNETLQLPWWGVLLACAIAIFFTLPIGIISATTNQAPGLNIITEYIIGYAMPGAPVANMCFKVYGYISMTQALTFIGDFKLGHYMKIPPRAMFLAQVVGTLVSVLVYQCTAWWLMATIPNICDTSKLPENSQWTCPQDRVFYDASVIWGLVGPRRQFGNLGPYAKVNYFFIGGAVAPFLVWLAHKAFPLQQWIRMIHMPILIGATMMMPPASSVNFTSWITLAFLSGFVMFRYKPKLWERYNYVLSGGLDAGTAFMSLLIFLGLQMSSIDFHWWGSTQDKCPLAVCPTAKGVVAKGCPVF